MYSIYIFIYTIHWSHRILSKSFFHLLLLLSFFSASFFDQSIRSLLVLLLTDWLADRGSGTTSASFEDWAYSHYDLVGSKNRSLIEEEDCWLTGLAKFKLPPPPPPFAWSRWILRSISITIDLAQGTRRRRRLFLLRVLALKYLVIHLDKLSLTHSWLGLLVQLAG